MKKRIRKAVLKSNSLQIGEVVKEGAVPLCETSRKGVSIYKPLFEKMALLKPGQMFLMPVPKGMTLAAFRQRLQAAMRHKAVKAPAGAKFRKTPTKDGKAVAVRCLPSK